MRACIPTCMHTYMHAYVHTCVHTCGHTCVHMCTHANTQTYVHNERILMHAYLHMCIPTYPHTFVHVCTRVYSQQFCEAARALRAFIHFPLFNHVHTSMSGRFLVPSWRTQVMSAEGVQADVVIYNILLKEEATVEGVESVLAGMRDAQVAPNDRTYG